MTTTKVVQMKEGGASAPPSDEKLSGLKKASILLTSLGATESARVFAQLNQKERETLGAQIVTLQHVSSVTRRSVMEEVSEYVRHSSAPIGSILPDRNVGPTEGHHLEDRVDPSVTSGGAFKWLESEDPDFAASVLERERPQSVALALAHLAPKPAAEILSSLRENVRNQVAHRLATMTTVSPQAVQAADEAIRNKMQECRKSFTGPVNADTDSTLTLAKILENATGRVRSSVIGAMSSSDPRSLTKLTALMSTPEDMTDLPDEDLRTVLSETRVDDLCLSLRVASDELKTKVLDNMFEEAAATVRRELETSGNYTILEIGNAQDKVMDVVRRLHDAGAIGRAQAA